MGSGSRGPSAGIPPRLPHLSMLEGYTYDGDEWSENAAVLAVKDVFPIQPGKNPGAD